VNLKKRKLGGVPLLFWVLFIVSMTTVSVSAFVINQLPTIRQSLFGQTYEASWFTVVTTESKIRKKYVEVKATISNTDVNTHSCKITCVFYDVDGNVLDEVIKTVTDLAGEDSESLTFHSDIAIDATYNSCAYDIRDTA